MRIWACALSSTRTRIGGTCREVLTEWGYAELPGAHTSWPRLVVAQAELADLIVSSPKFGDHETGKTV